MPADCAPRGKRAGERLVNKILRPVLVADADQHSAQAVISGSAVKLREIQPLGCPSVFGAGSLGRSCTGVQLATTFNLLPPVTTNGGTQRVARTAVAMGLVYASPQCTG